MDPFFSLIGLILALAVFCGWAVMLISCYLFVLTDGVGFVARRAGHRWVTIGLLLVVLSVVAGIAWNWLPGRVLVAVSIYFMPVLRLAILLWQKRKSEWTKFEKLYACLLFIVGAFSIVGPIWMIPQVVWQSLGPILHSS